MFGTVKSNFFMSPLAFTFKVHIALNNTFENVILDNNLEQEICNIKGFFSKLDTGFMKK